MKRSKGRVEVLRLSSEVLRGNALGDPCERDVYCYLPPGYDDGANRYPVIYFLCGFTGNGRMMFNFSAFGESMDVQLDRLIAAGSMPEVICVLPDCFTRLGGSQYVNSSATGRYEDYVIDEIVPFVDEKLRTKPGSAQRAVTGKSSGGYGSMRLAMRHPDVFGAFGSHAGDAYFAYCYLPDFPKLVMGLQRHGGVEKFFTHFESLPKKTDEAMGVLNILAMAACYSPNPSQPMGIDLPVGLPSGEIRGDVWKRWEENDPVHMARDCAGALRSMKRIFIDAGSRDEFNLHLGARIFCSRLDGLGVRYTYEEFDDSHMGINYRYDRSFVELGKAIAG
ncbi:MAG: esterase [Candidatus Eremiobacter antarcticus]|nr:esterase [Candidatus Eremiobacteraeota bacterium]MBC5807542.1 esterase [Candidatus Eremiobacteraeota bacterium]PZR61406.1 MAG: esterase [Candidatus Eremiobacter sp. RRmetagenome_bin22]